MVFMFRGIKITNVLRQAHDALNCKASSKENSQENKTMIDNLPVIRTYTLDRIEQLRREPAISTFVSGEGLCIAELERLIQFCDGLAKQTEVLSGYINFDQRCASRSGPEVTAVCPD